MLGKYFSHSFPILLPIFLVHDQLLAFTEANAILLLIEGRIKTFTEHLGVIERFVGFEQLQESIHIHQVGHCVVVVQVSCIISYLRF